MATILVIDDESALRRSIRRILETADHVVIEAENGRAGARLFGTHLPDLVITDMLMPEADGLDAIRELQRIKPDVKVLAISGGGQMQVRAPIPSQLLLQLANKLGAGAVLPKPFRKEELLAAVDRLLSASVSA